MICNCLCQDFISTLATESGGSVFSHESLVRASRESKIAASVFGRVIAQSGAPNTCQVRDVAGSQCYIYYV